jgi:glyoxylase I family protein
MGVFSRQPRSPVGSAHMLHYRRSMADAAGPVSGFSHVQLRVGDLAASVTWYGEALRLEPFVGSPDTGYVGMRHRASGVVLVLSDAGEGEGISGIGLDHLALAARDRDALEQWVGHLDAAGIDHSGLVESGEGTSIHLHDPDGLEIELLAPRPRVASR